MGDGPKLTIDLSPLFDAVSQGIDAINRAVSGLSNAIDQPLPWVEAVDLRDLAREHNLDRVDRGPATVRRDSGQLIAEWNGEEVTRYSEYEEPK